MEKQYVISNQLKRSQEFPVLHIEIKHNCEASFIELKIVQYIGMLLH